MERKRTRNVPKRRSRTMTVDWSSSRVVGTGGAVPTNRVARPRAFLPREQRHNYRRTQRGGAASASVTSTPEYRTRNRVSPLLYHILSFSLPSRFIRFVLIVSRRCTDLPLFTRCKCIFRNCNNEQWKNNAFLFSSNFSIHREKINYLRTSIFNFESMCN